MHHFAQTNIQLFNQLRGGGLTTGQLAMMRRGYLLAMRLFSGAFRPSGKPFIAHLVGTASILHASGASAELVAAGLLHSAYTHGDFGDLSRGASPARRALVRREVGPDVEDYVARYTELDWSPHRLDAILESVPRIDARDRDIVRVRLADKIEDHLDLGLMYTPSAAEQESAQPWRDKMIRIAEALDEASLASELRSVSLQTTGAQDPGLSFASTTSSFWLPGASLRVRLPLVLGRFGMGVFRRLRGTRRGS